MRRSAFGFILAILLIQFLIVPTRADSSGFLPRDSCDAGSYLSASYLPAYGCDNDQNTHWISTTNVSNTWFRVNLTGQWKVNGVLIHWDLNLPTYFNYEVWNGTAWVLAGGFVVKTGSGNTYQTYNLSANFTGTKIRFFADKQVGFYDIKPRGYVVTQAAVDFTPLWITLGIFVFLVIVGLRLPFIHVLAGLLGFFLSYQLYTDVGSIVLLGVVMILSVSLFFEGILRRV